LVRPPPPSPLFPYTTLFRSFALLLPLMSLAANYSVKTAAVDGVEAVQLTDAAHKTEVTVVPAVGNMAYRMMVNGKNALWVPYERDRKSTRLNSSHEWISYAV